MCLSDFDLGYYYLEDVLDIVTQHINTTDSTIRNKIKEMFKNTDGYYEFVDIAKKEYPDYDWLVIGNIINEQIPLMELFANIHKDTTHP